MLERMLLMRRDWQQRGGAVVFVWKPSHKVVFANQYADAVADAYIDDEPMEQHAQAADRGATLAHYEVWQNGEWSHMAGDRPLADVVHCGGRPTRTWSKGWAGRLAMRRHSSSTCPRRCRQTGFGRQRGR